MGNIAAVHDSVNYYFTVDCTEDPCWVTALKIATYCTVVIPATIWVLDSVLSCFDDVSVIQLRNMPANLKKVIDNTPVFTGYKVRNSTLLEMPVRPANLFFDKLLGENSTTKVGGEEHFAFIPPPAYIRNQIHLKDGIVQFSAKDNPYLASIYGNATYRISYQELQKILGSQKIYVSSLVPIEFYRSLKWAMGTDKIITLPNNRPVKDLSSPECAAFVREVQCAPKSFGFTSLQHLEDILNLGLYRLGSLVVKSEDYHIFMNARGEIIERNPGTQDAIRLISACGIRDSKTPGSSIPLQTIMTDTFKMVLTAADTGILVVPAIGMGVWGGDPDLYWRAFLDAVIASEIHLEQILVNPGHQTTKHGLYTDHNGDEFQTILDEYKKTKPHPNLNKIVNLYDKKTDVIHLAHNLKQEFPGKVISLLNASDPDVTLGNHVGEYVNRTQKSSTTEENYTAMGTNGLCFEAITGVQNDLERRIVVPTASRRYPQNIAQ